MIFGLNNFGEFLFKKSKLFEIEQWYSLSLLNEKVIFSKFKLLISIWNMNFGSKFNVMLKTKSTFSGEKVQIFETPLKNLEAVDVWEDDVVNSLLSWESAYQKPPGTWSQIFFCSKFQSLLCFWRVWGREVKVDTKKVFASSWCCCYGAKHFSAFLDSRFWGYL